MSKRLSGPRRELAELEYQAIRAELQHAEGQLGELSDRHAQVRDRRRSLERAEEAHVERQRLQVEMAACDAEQALLIDRLALAQDERKKLEQHREEMARELEVRSIELQELESRLTGNLPPEKRVKMRDLHSRTVRSLEQARASLTQQEHRSQAMEDRQAVLSDAVRSVVTRVEAMRARGKALGSAAKARGSATEALVVAERVEQDLRLLEGRRGRLSKQLEGAQSARRSGVQVRVRRW